MPCLGTCSGFTWDAVHVRNLQLKLGWPRPSFFFALCKIRLGFKFKVRSL